MSMPPCSWETASNYLLRPGEDIACVERAAMTDLRRCSTQCFIVSSVRDHNLATRCSNDFRRCEADTRSSFRNEHYSALDGLGELLQRWSLKCGHAVLFGTLEAESRVR